MILLGFFILISVVVLISVKWISAAVGFWYSVWWVNHCLISVSYRLFVGGIFFNEDPRFWASFRILYGPVHTS